MISDKKIFRSGLYADYLNLETKDEDVLYFCTDTKQIFKGTIDVTQEYQQVYNKPDDPAVGVLYASSENGTVETYNGTSWVEVFAPIVGTDTVYSVPLPEGETSVNLPMPDEGDVVDIYTDNSAQYTSIEVNDATGTRSANNTESLTVNFTQQEISDIVHMRTYHNDRYTASILASLCIDGIRITHPADTTVFTKDEVFDITGLQVAAIQGSEEIDITNSITTVPAVGTKLKNSGPITVRIVYGMLETSYNINVISIDSIEVTTLPNKTRYDADESLDLTGIVVAGYNNGKTISKIVTDDCKFVPPNGTVLTEEKTYTISVSYKSVNTTFDVTVSPVPSTLEECTWDQISSLVKSGKFAEHFKTGDTKSIVVNGVTYAMSAEINDGTGPAAEYYPANTVDFIINKIKATSQHNKSAFVDITYANGSYIRPYCTSIYNSLPADVKSVVIPKQKVIYTAENETTTINDNVWILSPIELGMPQPQNTYGYGYKTVDSTSYSKIYNIGNTTEKRAALLSEQDKYIGIWTSNSYILSISGGTYRGFSATRGASENYADAGSYPNGVHGVLWGFRIG